VRLAANGQTWVGDVPADRTEFPFTIEPLDLTKGTTVSATQEKCGARSQSSPAVPVDPHEDVKVPPVVVPPLYDCAQCVSVRNVHPGAIVQVWAQNANGTWEGPISDLVPLSDTQGTIPVAPYLRAGDQVHVIQWACGGKIPSRAEGVQPHPQLLPPTVVPAYSGGTAVEVWNVIPGALAEVYVRRKGAADWAFAGSAVANLLTIPTAVVYCPSALHTGDAVRARQSLCGVLTEFGPEATVRVPPPLVPDNLSPPSGATGVPLQPVLSWRDPGAQEERHADSFQGEIRSGGSPQGTLVHAFSPAGWRTSFQVPAPLKPNTAYWWQVRGVNSTGQSAYAAATFTTVRDKPVLHIVDKHAWEVEGFGFQSADTVVIDVVIEGSVNTAGGK
jgi:hypothetical protein